MHGLPAHPQRAVMPPGQVTWSARAFTTWLVVIAAASVGGAIASVLAVPRGHDMFDGPALLYALTGLTVLCGFAGAIVPKMAPYWGMIPVLPFLIAFVGGMAEQPANDASFAPVGFVLLFIGLAVPWATGFAAGLVRKAN